MIINILYYWIEMKNQWNDKLSRVREKFEIQLAI